MKNSTYRSIRTNAYLDPCRYWISVFSLSTVTTLRYYYGHCALLFQLLILTRWTTLIRFAIQTTVCLVEVPLKNRSMIQYLLSHLYIFTALTTVWLMVEFLWDFFLLWLAWNEYFFLAFNIFGTSPVEYIVDLTVFDGFSLDVWGSRSPASFYIYILGPPLINCSFALSQQKLLKPWFTI